MHESSNKILIKNNIVRLLVENNLSIDQFTSMLGANKYLVYSWLSGDYNFTLDQLSEIAYILDVEIYQLVTEISY